MRPTPRTDAAQAIVMMETGENQFYVYASLSRQLERELQKAVEIIAHLTGAAEVDCMDDKSNVWRSYMIDARAFLARVK